MPDTGRGESVRRVREECGLRDAQQVSGPPEVDGRRLVEWCRLHLRAEPVDELLRAGHLSSVLGLRLDDGRKVVVKVREAAPRLDACIAVQAALSQAGFPCPQPLTSVTDLDGSAVTAETYLPGGAPMPGTDREARPFAEAFAALIRLAPPPEHVPSLAPAPAWVAWNHQGSGLWPMPDDDDRDMNEIKDAPGWIDRAGRAAQDRLRAHRASDVIGHCDWYAGNLRWSGNNLLVAHDWDSVFVDSEAAVVGFAAAVYPTTDPGGEATLEETEQFIRSYVDVSDHALTLKDVECAWAAGVWLRAFDSRKQHAKGEAIRSLDETEAKERVRRAGAW